jgi:uncharacterized protein (DUF1330 family)
MAAYVIVTRESPLRDEAEKKTYDRKTREAPRDPNLKPLVLYGAVHPLEGTPPDGVVVLEFPTVEAAKAWYNSPGYQAALPHRLNSADYRAVIVEGLPPR